MKKALILLLAVGLGIQVSGQSISSYVVATAGESVEAGGLNVSWTLGEIAIETLESSDLILTQGFQQGYFEITSIGEPLSNNFAINVYPNPASEYVYVTLKSEEIKDAIIELFDLDGTLVYNGKLNVVEGPNKLELGNLSSSQYILRVSDNSGNVLQTFKLIKR